MPHNTVKDKEGMQRPEFHMDGCFLGDDNVSDNLTVFVVKERMVRMIMVSVTPSKSTGGFHCKTGGCLHAGSGLRAG